jgi:prepilin-type N-terminal cleavage/methylation domain-containing protein
MRSQRGFSLVEILVAFLILTVVMTISLAAFVERTRRLQQASEIILAYQALANEAEFRRRMDFAGLEKEPVEFVSDTSLLEPLAPFGTAVRVDPGETGIKHIVLTVRWRNGEREARLSLVRADTGGSSLW